jgi:hypothetical protein
MVLRMNEALSGSNESEQPVASVSRALRGQFEHEHVAEELNCGLFQLPETEEPAAGVSGH